MEVLPNSFTTPFGSLQNPELVARLDRLRAQQEQREYDQMVKNVDPIVSTIPLRCGVQTQPCNLISITENQNRDVPTRIRR